MEPAQVAERLGLGTLRQAASVLKAGEPYLAWKLTTDARSWVVKVCRPRGDFWRGAVAQAGKLEAAAWRAGVTLPEPLLPESAESGLWWPIGEDHYARAARFLDGSHPSAPFAPPLARWAGATAADLERLAIEVDPKVDSDFTSHPESDWDDWLAQAVEFGVLDRERSSVHKDVAMRINELAVSGLASRPVELVVHRDFSPANVLVTAEGPVLLDFDRLSMVGLYATFERVGDRNRAVLVASRKECSSDFERDVFRLLVARGLRVLSDGELEAVVDLALPDCDHGAMAARRAIFFPECDC